MAIKKLRYPLLAAGVSVVFFLAIDTELAFAHRDKHTAEQLKAFDDAFMTEVKIGDELFHGDAATQKRLNVILTTKGTACAMCHPWASDNHPHEFPKFQEQMNEFATLRDMINWCIEKPNEGEKIDPNGRAMKALEAYIYWSNRNSKLDPGRH